MLNWLKEHKGQLILNLITILIIASMLTIHGVKAAPEQQVSTQGFTPGIFSYQGFLANRQGAPLNGRYDMIFRLYDQPVDGNLLWEEPRIGPNQVPVNSGQVNLMLGGLKPIPDSVWGYPQLFLGVQVGADAEMTPRTIISAVPFALKAASANSVPDGSVTRYKLAEDVKIPEIQHGFLRCTSANCPSWNLNSGVGARLYTQHIEFPTAFSGAPTISLSVHSIDAYRDANLRFVPRAENISATGFDLIFETYADTIIFSAGVTWIAIY